MEHNFKRFLCLLVALVMVIGLMPMGHVHAEGETVMVIGEMVAEVADGESYVITLHGTKNALSNQQGSGAWGTHTLATGGCDKFADDRILWTLEAAEGGYKVKNANGYLNISRNAASLNETGHVFELINHGEDGWAIKSLETNEYGNNLGDSGSIGGWSGDGTKFDLYAVTETPITEIDPYGKLQGFWKKVSVDTETNYDWKEGLFEYAFDCNPATIWHSNWQGASDKLNGTNTFAGVIDFGAAYTINQFSFTPRVGNNSGQVTQASLYVKETEDAEWILVAEHATFEANGDKKDINFDAQAVQFVKFVAEQSSDGWVAVSEFDIDYIAPAAHEHSYEAVVTAPTCTEGGYTTYTCECGDTYVADETAALGHTPVTQPGYAAGCETPGMTNGSYCSVCDATITKQEVIPATGHAFGEWTETKAPTCTEDGQESRSCANCDETETRSIAKLGHKYEAVVTAPTCTEGGYTTYTCACGDTYTADETEALGHNDGPIVVENEKPSTCTEGGYYDAVCYCTVCGVETYRSHIEVGPDGHYPVVIPGHPATCTEPGLTDGTRCAVCLEWIEPQEEIPALGHTPVALPGYEATCTTDGMTDGSYCSVCDATITAQEVIPATGHTPVTLPGYAAGCETTGMTDGSYCSVCDATITAQEVIPALGHAYEDGTCTNCGAADPNYVEVIAEGFSGYTLWTLTKDGTMTISPSGKLYEGKCNMRHYYKVNGVLTLPWSEYAEQITKVVVEDGVNGIGQMAFYELPNLKEVVLADSVEEIYGYSFKNCKSLTTINLEVVEVIREGAFYGCAALENITFAEGVVIQDWAFTKTPVVLP